MAGGAASQGCLGDDSLKSNTNGAAALPRAFSIGCEKDAKRAHCKLRSWRLMGVFGLHLQARLLIAIVHAICNEIPPMSNHRRRLWLF